VHGLATLSPLMPAMRSFLLQSSNPTNWANRRKCRVLTPGKWVQGLS